MADERIQRAYNRMWKRMGILIGEGNNLDARGIGWAVTIMEDVFPELKNEVYCEPPSDLAEYAEGSEG